MLSSKENNNIKFALSNEVELSVYGEKGAISVAEELWSNGKSLHSFHSVLQRSILPSVHLCMYLIFCVICA